MSLLCGACDDDMRGGYLVLGFLGRTGNLIAQPENTPISVAVCTRHISDRDCEDLVAIENDLVFSVATGSSTSRGNFNGNFCMDDEVDMKKRANFETVRYISGRTMRRKMPGLLDTLLRERGRMSGDLAAFRTALESA
jgi:hypothetical protein